jgi:hypothetical protein
VDSADCSAVRNLNNRDAVHPVIYPVGCDNRTQRALRMPPINVAQIIIVSA